MLNRKRTVESFIMNEAVEVAVSEHLEIDPTVSTRRVSERSNVSLTTIQKIFKKHNYHPYKINLVHEDENNQRLQFCESMNETVTRDKEWYL